MKTTIAIRYAIVFRVDGLDLEGVIESLSKYGTVFNVEDNYLDEPVKIVYIECSMAKAFQLRLDYNCVSPIDNNYVLFPMATYEDKRKVILSEKAR